MAWVAQGTGAALALEDCPRCHVGMLVVRTACEHLAEGRAWPGSVWRFVRTSECVRCGKRCHRYWAKPCFEPPEVVEAVEPWAGYA